MIIAQFRAAGRVRRKARSELQESNLPAGAHCCEGAWAIIVPAAVPSTEFEEERYSTVIAGSPMRPSTVTPHCESPHSVWRVAPSGSVMVTRSFTAPGGCWVAMLTRRVCGASGPPTR